MIQTNQEQNQAAKNCGKRYCCLAHQRGTTSENWTWVVALTTDSEWEADEWWRQQTSYARVLYSNGNIRNAK